MAPRRAGWSPASFEDALSFLAHPKLEYHGGSRSEVTPPWDLRPRNYLAFARTDLNQRGTRGRVNALGNGKRALHCQIDAILYGVGLWERAQERHWDFNTKTALLQDMQIMAPGVLGRINRLRNEVEHEYSVPSDHERLADFIDAIELFVSGTDFFARGRYDDLEFTRPYRSTERDMTVLYDDTNGQLVAEARRREIVRLDPTDKRYKRLLVATFVAARRAGVFH